MNPGAPWGSGAELRGRRAGSYLTIPAAFPRALAWAYRFLATVFSFTEPTNTIPFTFLLTDRRQDKARTCGDAVEPGSHGEVGDEGPFGDLHVEADALSLGARVDHGAPDGGVDEARGDPALHLVALNGDVISTDGLARPPGGVRGEPFCSLSINRCFLLIRFSFYGLIFTF